MAFCDKNDFFFNLYYTIVNMVYYLNYIIRKKAFLHLLYYGMLSEPKEFCDEKIVFIYRIKVHLV